MRVATLYSTYHADALRFVGASVRRKKMKNEVRNATIPKRINMKVTNPDKIRVSGKVQRFMGPWVTKSIANKKKAIIAAFWFLSNIRKRKKTLMLKNVNRNGPPNMSIIAEI